MANPLEFNKCYFTPVLNESNKVVFASGNHNNFKENVKSTCDHINAFINANREIMNNEDTSKRINEMMQKMNSEVQIKYSQKPKIRDSLSNKILQLTESLIPAAPSEDMPPVSPLLQREKEEKKEEKK